MCDSIGLSKEAVMRNLCARFHQYTMHGALVAAYCLLQEVSSREALTDYEREGIRRDNVRFQMTGELPSYAKPYAFYVPGTT